MSARIPHALTAEVRFSGPHWLYDGTRDKLYLFAAHKVIEHYVHRNLFAEAMTNVSEFLEGYTGQGHVGYNLPLRIMMIGETVFLLRASQGFGEICRRLESRDLRSAYYEMIAAKQFLRAGFDIEAKPEIFVKGEDFDFAALRLGRRINVEVTALRQKLFSTATVVNALNQKRRQLPRTSPSVIFCVLPEEWRRATVNLNIWSATIANNFLRQTQRVNAVVLSMEQHQDFDTSRSRGALYLINKVFFNIKPLFPCDLSFLNFSYPFRPQATSTMARLGLLDNMTQDTRRSEFFQWVDSLVPHHA